MPSTVIADIDFNSEQFAEVAAGEFTHKLGLLSSNILSEVPDSVVSKGATGFYAHMPKWDVLSGTPDRITTSLSTTVNALGTADSIAVWVEREKAFGADQMVKVATSNDPMNEAAMQVGQYVASAVHADAVARLGGAFATALGTSHSTGGTYAGATITLEGGIAARQLLGDNQDNLSAVVMNSKVKSDALLKKIVTELPNTQGAVDAYNSGNIPYFLGSQVYASDKLTATASVYPTYFASPGAMIYKMRNRPSSTQTNANVFNVSFGGLNVEVERARVSLTAGGQDVLIIRASFFTHIPGTAWNISGGGANPTDAALATSTNWTKTASDDKEIKIVQLKTL